MGRKQPRILGSLRNPLPPQTSPPSMCPNGTHLFPSQSLSPQPSSPTNPLSVFYPTSFPPLKNTSYFPTLMVAMPSSSCIDKLCSKSPSFLTPNSCCSTLMSTSAQATSLDSCLDSLSHQEAKYLRTAWVSKNLKQEILAEGLLQKCHDCFPSHLMCEWFRTGHESHSLFPQVPGKKQPEAQTRNFEVKNAQVLVKLSSIIEWVSSPVVIRRLHPEDGNRCRDPQPNIRESWPGV
ncbi:uncharacterized protein LOC110540329 [Meriones unguiculatus]|uniref:uncharacterized protein LOC110540329 n=1 Tax=Meriones unguiculatus TaxID=10047 RepID=UPI00293E7BFE|nr:uncharacterized protein LOC110540329 [Meriones unguiculatus]